MPKSGKNREQEAKVTNAIGDEGFFASFSIFGAFLPKSIKVVLEADKQEGA